MAGVLICRCERGTAPQQLKERSVNAFNQKNGILEGDRAWVAQAAIWVKGVEERAQDAPLLARSVHARRCEAPRCASARLAVRNIVTLTTASMQREFI